MIEVRDVSASIGPIRILSGVSLAAARGRFVTVIGANGAGKTTLLRTISNLLTPSSGRVTFDGKDTRGIAPHRLARTGLVHVPQGRQIVPALSVEDNLMLGASNIRGLARGDIREAIEREYARFPVLRARAGIAGGNLSGGEQQMLAISRAVLMKPKALLLDEPSLGLAPQLVALILKALREMADAGVAVILVEQLAMMSLSIADDAYVLRQGRIVLSGPAADLRGNASVVESYLT
ncbi:MAG: ABC transporter ATP-binding protein [Myxococcales bacterium]|nr:ABC transporter ATP-binding protein [Myxococcales bacterium]